jgi:hypothetical protein
MHIYYIAGIPYSDDLYHSGVKGQKWGLRRYQYEDGTLTPLGKIHYGAQKTGQAVGRAVKATGKAVGKVAKKAYAKQVESYKKKHPEKMTEAELREHISRIKMENEYREMIRTNKKPVSTGKRIVQDIIESSSKALVSGAIDRLNISLKAKDQVKRDKEREKRLLKKEKKNPSYKVKKYVQKNWTTMDDTDVNDAVSLIGKLRKIEGNNK